jgi:bifunctional non-homologous end joining protein LigD
MVFDLDPGEGVEWNRIVQAALDIRDHLRHAGLRSHPLLSGGKGLHVVVPLDGTDGWADVKRFARALAYVQAEDAPNRFVAVASKSQRKGRIFIDWLRNGRGATSIAAWSLRARNGAPVAMPITWRSLQTAEAKPRFDLARAASYTCSLREHPWGDYRSSPQRLPGSARRP